MLPEKEGQAYRAFYSAARNNEILDSRTTLMLHLAAAMAYGCYP